MKYLYSLLLLFCMVSCKQDATKPLMSSETETQSVKKSALIEAFTYQPDALPIISAHRGGKNMEHYPENCLETLQYVNDSIPAIYEIDVAKTKDHQLVLLHDNSLERTTTGAGRLTAFTYQQLKNYNLKDAYGNVTSFKIPLFSDVLKWAIANDAVLTVDIKRSVEVKVVIDTIRQEQAEDHCIIITYDMEQAKKAYALAPELLLSVSARNDEELEWLMQSQIPTENMLAFTGTRLSTNEFYNKVQSQGIKTILGTLGNLDQQAETKGDITYKVWQEKGIDVFATDRPFAVAKALNITKQK